MDHLDQGTCRPIDSEILNRAKRFEEVEAALRSALVLKEEFYLNIQPIYNTEAGRFESAEVLLRFNSKEFGMIPPNEFITVAERIGLIFDIDRMVVRKTCRFIQTHPELSEAGVKFLQINLSASEFVKNIYDEISAIVREYDVDPRSICFEVTETAATSDPEILQEFMDDMISDGYRFALDDFGTGFANLMQTVSYPFELIKIDRDFLLSDNSRSMTMFDDLLRMFPRMELETITEGVETEEQSKRVTGLGGKYIQGYYYSKPLSEEDFVRFAASH
jgi:EAL domain-containing protein (putative c-di-GMP-specific phosphodiesterase class I)